MSVTRSRASGGAEPGPGSCVLSRGPVPRHQRGRAQQSRLWPVAPTRREACLGAPALAGPTSHSSRGADHSFMRSENEAGREVGRCSQTDTRQQRVGLGSGGRCEQNDARDLRQEAATHPRCAGLPSTEPGGAGRARRQHRRVTSTRCGWAARGRLPDPRVPSRPRQVSIAALSAKVSRQ